MNSTQDYYMFGFRDGVHSAKGGSLVALFIGMVSGAIMGALVVWLC